MIKLPDGTEIYVGDMVHLGIAVRGGAGFTGKFIGMNDLGNKMIVEQVTDVSSFGPRTWSGYPEMATKL
jgi:hypothetical protein